MIRKPFTKSILLREGQILWRGAGALRRSFGCRSRGTISS